MLNGDYIRGTSSDNMTIDLVHKGINKAKGVADMLKHYGIAQKDLIAFGDGENDIGMLEACGYSYAMKNANEKTKAVAKYEAPSNDDNGVLQVLAKYLDVEC
ncbi:Cof family protein [Lactobacillus helveticus CIRM-BIA 103]|nr:HAD-IIB family hydrolase [Lactobacillus helveticus]CDI63524.1 Cof family protein [Lactobacillus helveticus CIRM-BIA 103]